jgi:hypothetical protein
VDVAGVRVAHAVAQCDLAGAGERRRRRALDVQHLEVGMERGEVHRHFGPEVLDDPGRHRMELLVGVVPVRNQQIGDLHPDVGLVHEVLERVEHRTQVTTTDVAVEVLGERLEVDVGGVHRGEELAARLRLDVPGGDGNGVDAALVARGGDVDGVLHEDDGVVVGERDRTAPVRHRGARNGVGRRIGGECFHLARL